MVGNRHVSRKTSQNKVLNDSSGVGSAPDSSKRDALVMAASALSTLNFSEMRARAWSLRSVDLLTSCSRTGNILKCKTGNKALP